MKQKVVESVNLARLKCGAKLRIQGYQGISNFPHYRQKLLAMGLTPNTIFTLIRRAPLGDPIEIRVRDASLIVRQDELSRLMLQVVG